MLKPQDIVILLKIISMTTSVKDRPKESISQNKLATYLCMSVSEVNAGIQRLRLSGLLGLETLVPIKAACEECLISGVKYFIPVETGAETPGIPTSYAAPIFKEQILMGKDSIPVWPYVVSEHTTYKSEQVYKRGFALEPLYRSVPQSVTQYPDWFFYDLLVLIDAIRSGRTRERNIAIKLLKDKINYEQEKGADEI